MRRGEDVDILNVNPSPTCGV